MFQQTSKNRVLFKRTLTSIVLGVLSIATILYGGFAFHSQSAYAAVATDSTVNFQARLEGPGGAIAPDGYYNIQFKLYNDPTTGSALWTESYYDSNGVTAGNDNRVQVINGYVTVNLGSQTPFSGINWDQSLYLTMNIGGTAQTATPTYDGEMSPRLSLTAVPYAFSAGQLSQYNATTGFTSSLSIVQPTGGNQVFQIPDQGAAGTYNLLTQSSASTNFIQNQNASAQTSSNFWISGSGRAASLLAGSFDTASSGTLTVGGTNATTINIANNNVAHTVNIATGSAAQTVTIGSTDSTSSTTIQGGNQGIGLHASSAGTIGLYIGASNVFGIDTFGRVVVKSISNAVDAFDVQNSLGNPVLQVDTVNNQLKSCGSCGLYTGTGGLLTDGAISFGATGNYANYTTPVGSSIQTKIMLPNADPGAYGQLIALGLPSTAASTSRAITLLDARTGAHQPTLAVLTPDENNIAGLSWDGSNSIFSLKTTTGSIALSNSGGTGFSLTASGSNQLASLGTGSSTNGQLQFNNATNSSSTTLQAPSVSTSYITNLPTAIGTAGQCLTVASVVSVTQTLGYGTCGGGGGSGVTLQASSPGTPDTGNLNISGVGIFGASVLAPTLDTASGVGMNIGTATATTITIGRTGQGLTINSSAGTTVASGYVLVNGSTTNSYKLQTSGTVNSSLTTTQYGVNNAVDFNPSGASLSNINGLNNLANVSGSSLNLSTLIGSNDGVSTGASYSGTVADARGVSVAAPVIGGTKKFTSYSGAYINGNSVNGGNTTGTLTNNQLNIQGITAGAGSGGTVNNYGINLTQPAGSGGTTNNYGLYIQGAGGGTANWSIYNASSAASYFAGNLLIGTTSNSGGYAVNIQGTLASSTSLLTPSLDVASAGTLSIGTVTATAITIGSNGANVSIPSIVVFGGTVTTASTYRVRINGTLSSSSTSSHYGFDNSINFNPSGASITNIYGMNNSATVTGSALTIAQAFASVTGISTTSGFTGKIQNAYGLNISTASIGGSQKFDNYTGIYVSPNTDNGGNTSGTINNNQIYALGSSAGAGSGGTVNNYGVRIAMSTGSGGTTNNYGLYIQGAGAGSSNWSLYNSSSNSSYFAGNVLVGTTSNSGGYALNIQGSAAASTSLLTPAIDAISSGTLTIGSVTATSIVLGSASNNMTLTSGTFEPVLNGTARHSKVIKLTAEYPGSVLDSSQDASCVSANNGTLTSGFTGTTSLANFYKWTSAIGTAQCYDVVVKMQVPSDFAAWNGAPTVGAYSSDGTASIKVETRDTTGALGGNNYTSLSPGTATWTTGSLSSLTGTYTAGSTMYLRIRLTSTSGNYAEVGDITFNYYSNY